MNANDRSASTHRALASNSRQALLDALRRARRPLDADEAAREVGLHRNTARVHLELLGSSGLVERVVEERTERGRPRILYRLSPKARGQVDSQRGDVDYQSLAGILAQSMSANASAQALAEDAGRRWADSVALPSRKPHVRATRRDVEDLVELLYDLGFEPELAYEPEKSLIELHSCPVADVAIENRAVVCGVHLGMMQSSAKKLAKNMQIDSLESVVSEEPWLCVAHISHSARSSRSPRKEQE